LSKEEQKELEVANAIEEVKKQKEEAPDKKETKKKPKTNKKPKKLVHIDSFIEAIRIRIDLSDAQAKGFKAYMTGNHYAKSLNDFVPYLEKYTGKKVG